MKKTVAYPTSILSFFPGNKPPKLLPVHMGYVSSYSFEPPLVDIPSLIGHNWVRLLGKLLLKSWLAWSYGLLPSLPSLLPLTMWIWWPDYISHFLIMRRFWGSKLWDQAERRTVKESRTWAMVEPPMETWTKSRLILYEKKSYVLSSLDYFGFLLYVITGACVPWGQESLSVMFTGIS